MPVVFGKGPNRGSQRASGNASSPDDLLDKIPELPANASAPEAPAPPAAAPAPAPPPPPPAAAPAPAKPAAPAASAAATFAPLAQTGAAPPPPAPAKPAKAKEPARVALPPEPEVPPPTVVSEFPALPAFDIDKVLAHVRKEVDAVIEQEMSRVQRDLSALLEMMRLQLIAAQSDVAKLKAEAAALRKANEEHVKRSKLVLELQEKLKNA